MLLSLVTGDLNLHHSTVVVQPSNCGPDPQLYLDEVADVTPEVCFQVGLAVGSLYDLYSTECRITRDTTTAEADDWGGNIDSGRRYALLTVSLACILVGIAPVSRSCVLSTNIPRVRSGSVIYSTIAAGTR